MSNGNDIYTAKAVKQSATIIGYWLLAASLVHAFTQPIVAGVVNRISAQMYANEMKERMQNAFNRPAP